MACWIVRSPLPSESARYLGGAALVALAFIALYFFFVASHAGQSADQLAYDGAQFGHRSVTPFTRGLLDSVPSVAVVLAFLVTGLIAVLRRNWRTLVVALGVAAAAVLSAQLLKHGLLDRPDLGVSGYAGNSFPSGHTTVAAASALVVFLVASPRLRPILAVAGTAFAVLAGAATLANQWHRPSDVIASLLVVAFWGCVGGAVLAWPRSGAGTRAPVNVQTTRLALPRASTFTRLLRVSLVPFAAVAGIALAATFVFEFRESVDLFVAYVGGVTAIVTAGLTLALTGIRLFSRLP
ncbi:phosphatase PAP2 family protein [Cryobacterium psychrophilum]|uniref:Phosphatase PAP2 family protein n=1 Tax=Cryobacterium psychrophilum TaxID=41988 RepID=A0A4Y8KP04_9MICO|nr:phosphatase PAP2 family protein [Cryobacterium psychrophilum]TDW29362.1 PAP2 superfamily protein [Cryobacterium psychrophilum]TFD80030.1 phosphatase PAP2 family protein [Cryobacterium psychrophilum]